MSRATLHTARAFWVVRPGHGEVRTMALSAPVAGEVVIEALCSGVSRGTEALVFSGRVPEGERERMRAPHQEGDFPGPVKYGYASVGRVVDGPEGLRGRAVFCLYPHQDRYVVDAAEVVPLPPEVPPARAVLAANLETALNGVWDARIGLGDRVAVVGAGVVGCLAGYLAARIPGTEVELIDPIADRATIAAALGCGFAAPARARGEADVVVHASGAPEGLGTALALAGPEATVLELSWYGDQPVSAPLGGAFHARRLRLQSSQVGNLPARQRPRWTHRRRLALALSLLADPALDALISSESSLDDLPAVMAELAGAAGAALCHRVRYSDTL
jgi:hypothetical protein